MVSLMKTTELANMGAAFPSASVHLRDRPALKGLVQILSHLVDCAQSHRTPGQPMEKLHLVIPLTLLANYLAARQPRRTGDPGDVPFYGPNATQQQQKTTENNFLVQYKQFHDKSSMDDALIERFYTLLPPEHAQDLRDVVVTIPNPSFL